MAATTTVRVRPDTRAAIASLSEQRGVAAADLVGELVARAEERSVWEQTLLDGLVAE